MHLRAEEVYTEALSFTTVAGTVPEGERWEKERNKKINEIKEAVKTRVHFDNEKGQPMLGCLKIAENGGESQ